MVIPIIQNAKSGKAWTLSDESETNAEIIYWAFLHQQGLTYEIPDCHPLQIAPIADYRGGWIKEPEATDEEAKNEYTLIDR